MSKPKKMTEGHSSGPQAYWDSISGAENERLQAEIERLRGLVKLGFPYSLILEAVRVTSKGTDFWKLIKEVKKGGER